MRYFIYLLLVVAILAGITGALYFHRVSVKNKKEMSKYNGFKIEVKKNFGNVLVIYHSLSGRTKDIAERIKAKTNADIYEIKTKEELPKPPKLHLVVKKQLKSGNYFEIEGSAPDLSKYDIIFVGAPVWWYTVSTPMLSFLRQTNFAGKKVVPFSTQGSNEGNYFEDFIRAAKNARIMQSAQFNNLPKKYNAEVDNKISAWLNELDL